MSEIIAGTYELREKLGSGGGGNVFLAYHLRLGKEVVLKACLLYTSFFFRKQHGFFRQYVGIFF